MEFLITAIALGVTVIVLCYLFNQDYWQGYWNSKYLDEELKHEQRVSSKSTKNKNKDSGGQVPRVL